MTLTSTEAARALGISTGALRLLVHRRRISPVRAGAKPLRFHVADVYELQVARRPARAVAEHEAVWAEVDAELASQVSAV